ncbi:MAG: hypothetical protein LBR80_10330 [Deltaproteobacteria bacterium]|nr:hypothetical protein [Deltaproteobacteria bacterium]
MAAKSSGNAMAARSSGNAMAARSSGNAMAARSSGNAMAARSSGNAMAARSSGADAPFDIGSYGPGRRESRRFRGQRRKTGLRAPRQHAGQRPCFHERG